jgi:hypothetical protein
MTTEPWWKSTGGSGVVDVHPHKAGWWTIPSLTRYEDVA